MRLFDKKPKSTSVTESASTENIKQPPPLTRGYSEATFDKLRTPEGRRRHENYRQVVSGKLEVLEENRKGLQRIIDPPSESSSFTGVAKEVGGQILQKGNNVLDNYTTGGAAISNRDAKEVGKLKHQDSIRKRVDKEMNKTDRQIGEYNQYLITSSTLAKAVDQLEKNRIEDQQSTQINTTGYTK